jgi:hypothetical protein
MPASSISRSSTSRILMPLAGGDVVDLARPPALDRQPVGAHHVAHVGEVADRVEVADADHRRRQPGLDGGDLLGEVRGDEDVAAPRPGVVEAAGAQHLEAVALEVLVAEEVLPTFDTA